MNVAAVRVFVTDLGRAEAWYRRVLDAPPTAGGADDGFVVFDTGCQLGDPEPQGWGGILATIADPDGNRLQLVQYP